jgi:hypothetical protein
MTNRPYDNPRLNAIQFLLEVMHDPTLSLALRLDAANSLLKTDAADLTTAHPPAIIYRLADYRDQREHNNDRAA